MQKAPFPSLFDSKPTRNLFSKRGIVFLKSFSGKISLVSLCFVFEIFGKVTRFFFLPLKKKKKIFGWIEFSKKTSARKADIFFKKFSSQAPSPWNSLKPCYLKNFRWEKIISGTERVGSKKNY